MSLTILKEISDSVELSDVMPLIDRSFEILDLVFVKTQWARWQHRICKICGKQFMPRSHQNTAVYCSPKCQYKDYYPRWWAENRERKIKQNKEWWARHPEARREQSKRFRLRHKDDPVYQEKQRKYRKYQYMKHREKRIEATKRWQRNNPDKVLSNSRKSNQNRKRMMKALIQEAVIELRERGLFGYAGVYSHISVNEKPGTALDLSVIEHNGESRIKAAVLLENWRSRHSFTQPRRGR